MSGLTCKECGKPIGDHEQVHSSTKGMDSTARLPYYHKDCCPTCKVPS